MSEITSLDLSALNELLNKVGTFDQKEKVELVEQLLSFENQPASYPLFLKKLIYYLCLDNIARSQSLILDWVSIDPLQRIHSFVTPNQEAQFEQLLQVLGKLEESRLGADLFQILVQDLQIFLPTGQSSILGNKFIPELSLNKLRSKTKSVHDALLHPHLWWENIYTRFNNTEVNLFMDQAFEVLRKFGKEKDSFWLFEYFTPQGEENKKILVDTFNNFQELNSRQKEWVFRSLFQPANLKIFLASQQGKNVQLFNEKRNVYLDLWVKTKNHYYLFQLLSLGDFSQVASYAE